MNHSHGLPKINLKSVRRHCLDQGITVAELARMIGCSRESIYFALERPERYSRVYASLCRHILPPEPVLA